MINLSDTELTKIQSETLNLGLKFIPTPNELNQNAVNEQVRQFGRKIKIKYFFGNQTNKKPPEKFIFKSNWSPPFTHPKIVEKLDLLEDLVITTPNTNQGKPNLTLGQQQAIKSLKNMEQIVIKPADKGSATVIMNKVDYVREANRQLANKKHYASLNNPVYPLAATAISSVLSTLRRKGYISDRQVNYLQSPIAPRHRQLYLLPKIHKPPDTWHQPGKMPPGRPIISDCGSESYRIAEFIDHFLAPLAVTHAAYVKDTTDFLDKITKLSIPNDALLFSMDVESLYTNIDNTAGLKAVKQAFDRMPDTHRPDKEILELLDISLKHNDFQFQSKWFLQTWGTAMGKKFAPNYANIFMAEWEVKALAKCDKLPLIYLRFLDDIFGVWQHGEVEFQRFLTTLNAHQKCITLTSVTSHDSIDFLDTTIFKGDRFRNTSNLDSKVYFKPTDTHQLLYKSSFHPGHTFSGILKSQILRFYRICNNKTDFDEALSILFKSLRHRGYGARFLRAIKNATLNSIHNESRTEAAVRCNGRRCQTCPLFREFTPEGGKQGEIKTNNCGTTNLVYIITCTLCGARYIGETGSDLRTRVNQHRSDINYQNDTAIAKHFNSTGHGLSDMAVSILQSGPFSEDAILEKTYRVNAESLWIKKYKTVIPNGLNTKPDLFGILPFVIQFSRKAKGVSKLTRSTYKEIQLEFPRIFTAKFITAYSRNKNLKEMLVSTRLR